MGILILVHVCSLSVRISIWFHLFYSYMMQNIKILSGMLDLTVILYSPGVITLLKINSLVGARSGETGRGGGEIGRLEEENKQQGERSRGRVGGKCTNRRDRLIQNLSPF